MPYASTDDLPGSIRRALPSHAQDIFRSAFNRAWDATAPATPGVGRKLPIVSLGQP